MLSRHEKEETGGRKRSGLVERQMLSTGSKVKHLTLVMFERIVCHPDLFSSAALYVPIKQVLRHATKNSVLYRLDKK